MMLSIYNLKCFSASHKWLVGAARWVKSEQEGSDARFACADTD